MPRQPSRSPHTLPPSPLRERPPWQRAALLLLGCTFVAIGVAGLFLPLVPGTVFLILAAACFTRSSPRFERWLLDHPRLGPPVRDWRKHRAIPRQAKWIACLSLAASWGLILLSQAPAPVKAGCLVLFVAVAIYIATRPDGPGSA